MTALEIAREAIAAWHRGNMATCETELKRLAAAFPRTWDVTLVEAQPPREMMRRMISLVERDGKSRVVIHDKGASS